MIMKKIFILFLASTLITACLPMDSVTDLSRLNAVLLNTNTVRIEPGESKTLSIVITPKRYEEKVAIRWESNDTTVVIVNQYGEITAVSGGTTTVTVSATHEKITVKANCEVEVYMREEWALLCGKEEKTWVWDDTAPEGPWGNGGYKGNTMPGWWVVKLEDIDAQAPGEGAGASMTFSAVGARLTKKYSDGTSAAGTFGFSSMNRIIYDDSGAIWSKGKIKTKNVSMLCGQSPNEAGAPVYSYEILKLTEDKMVLSYPEPGVSSWGTAWFWMFRKK